MDRVARRRGGWGFGVAVIAACLLVLQSISGALALGQGQSTQLDIFGNPLCITSMDQSDHGSGGAGHDGMLKCCALGCSMFSQALGAAPQFAVEVIARPLLSDVPQRDYGAVSPPARSHVTGNPRAPPLAA